MTDSTPNIDPSIFTDLQSKIDEETAIRESLKTIIEDLTKQSRLITSHLSRIHNTPTPLLASSILEPTATLLTQQASTLQNLSVTASAYSFYKYNSLWARQTETLLASLQLYTYLSQNRLISLAECGTFLGVPVNVKPPANDAFHLTIEEYLLALTGTVEELARLAPNSVTLGDLGRPVRIARFVKDVHAGFQLLNLKNDALRRRGDGVKYAVKRCEDVVYDLSLRGLVPRDGEGEGGGEVAMAGSGSAG
jgi:predicted translin family RNA/ssDNA-binding protein